MSGPVASILLREPLSGERRDALNHTLKSVSKYVQGESFYVSNTLTIHGKYQGKGRPFTYYEEPIDAVLSAQELDRVEAHFGFRPDNSLVIVAEEDDLKDHQILGELTLALAAQLEGLIEFGGSLPEPARLIEGLLEVVYESAPAGASSTHVGTPDFLREWLGTQAFRMSAGTA